MIKKLWQKFDYSFSLNDPSFIEIFKTVRSKSVGKTDSIYFEVCKKISSAFNLDSCNKQNGGRLRNFLLSNCKALSNWAFKFNPRCHLHIEKNKSISSNKNEKKKILGLVPSMYARVVNAST